MSYNMFPKDTEIQEVIKPNVWIKNMDGSMYIQHNLGGILWCEYSEGKDVKNFAKENKVLEEKEDLCSILCAMWSEGRLEESFTEEREASEEQGKLSSSWLDEKENLDGKCDTNISKLVEEHCLPDNNVQH